MADTQALNGDRGETARHFAARAIMAMRAEFPVESIALHADSGAESSIVYDWKLCRGECADDVTPHTEGVRLCLYRDDTRSGECELPS
jgi:hypothetical protein